MKPASGPQSLALNPGWTALAVSSMVMACLGLSGCKPEDPAPPPAPSAKAAPAAPAQPSQETSRRLVRRQHQDPSRRGVVFHRGVYSPVAADPQSAPPAQPLPALTGDQKAKVAALLAQLRSRTITREIAMDIVAQARELVSADALPLLSALLQYPDKDVRGTAMALLLGTNDKTVLPVIDQALADPEPDVRLQAIEATSQVIDPATAPVLAKAFADKDLSVRQIAFQSAIQQDPVTRGKLLKSAVASPDVDLATVGLGYVESQSSKQSIALMMGALDHPDPFIREKAHDSLYLIMHQDFKSAEQGRSWWLQNQGLFDDNLVIKDASAFPDK